MPRDTTNRPTQNRHETTSDRRTMGQVSHTNPKTGESFGDSQVYERGRIAVVDGGEAGRRDESDPNGEDADGSESMGDIDHTPREGAPDANDVYARGMDADEDDDEESSADEQVSDDSDESNVETEV